MAIAMGDVSWAKNADELQLNLGTLGGSSAAAVGLYLNAESMFASCDGRNTTAAFEPRTPVRAGCINKVFVASMVAQETLAGGPTFAADVTDWLPIADLTGIQVRHLLNHTHGLDGATVPDRPVLADGSIDVLQLYDIVRKLPRLAPPGEMYNYSSIGPWFAAAILERIHGKPYLEILRSQLLAQFLTRSQIDELVGGLQARDVCAATGGDQLRLSTEHLLAFARLNLHAERQDAPPQTKLLSTLRRQPFRPLQWQPKLHQVCLGWNDLGNDWFGHSSRLHGESALLRWSPSRQIAIAVAAMGEDTAHIALGKLFGAALPEFADVDIPRFLSATEWSAVDTSRYVGDYGNSGLTVTIDVAANRALRARVYLRSDGLPDDEPYIKRYLKPAANEIFYATPPEHDVIPCIQFLAPGGAGKYQYLYTGKQILPRTGAIPSPC